MSEFTHKGWFGLCPVYFANMDTPSPLIHERHWSLLPLMMLSEWIFSVYFFLRTSVNSAYEPQWPLKITGELPKVSK